MKAQMLKMAGVKNDEEFYSKFPTEEAFMAKYGKAFKKAQMGANIPPVDQSLQGYPGYQPIINPAALPKFPQPGFAANEPIYNPSTQSGLQTYNPGIDVNQNREIVGEGALPDAAPLSGGFDPTSLISPVTGLIGGIQALGAQKKERAKLRQSRKVTDLQALASGTREKDPERRYVRPEDISINPGELNDPYGRGTNILTAKSGAKLTKCQDGGAFEKNVNKFYPMANTLTKALGDNNAGSQIGSSLGELGGMATGIPGMGKALGVVGGVVGGMLDPDARAMKRDRRAINNNMNTMMFNQGAQGFQNQYSAIMEDGGEISEMENGGDMSTHWGGYAEPISYNPNLPNSGETVMFRGQSHDNGGIGVKYGNSPVEVEGGEPAMELPDNNGGTNLTVFGDIKIPNEFVSLLGDEKAKGKKFKSYVADLSKNETKQNKISDMSIKEVNDMPVVTSFDKLKLRSLEANLIGTDMKLKDIAKKKMNAAHLQEAMNSTAEEFNTDPNKIATAKFGRTIPKAARGMSLYDKEPIVTTTPETTAPGVYTIIGNQEGSIDHNTKEDAGGIFSPNNYTSQWLPKVKKAFSNQDIAAKLVQSLESYSGQDAQDVKSQLAKQKTMSGKIQRAYELATDGLVGPYHSIINNLIDYNQPVSTPDVVATQTPAAVTAKDNIYPVVPYERNWMADAFNQVLPFIRPTDQEPLDPNQLMGEMYAMSNNQLEPVQAQTYQPNLNTPFDISYQDMRNENQADYRSSERTIGGNNPEAMALLNGQKYNANMKVNAEEFRQNQGERSRVFEGNRNTLNDAQLKNIATYDNQYQRQTQARSTTKATTQSALNSIASKYAQNALENRTLGIYENTYKDRYDAAGRLINMNPLFQPNMPYVYGKDGKPTHRIIYDNKGNITNYEPIDDLTPIPSAATPPINGNKKKYGGSIVRDFK